MKWCVWNVDSKYRSWLILCKSKFNNSDIIPNRLTPSSFTVQKVRIRKFQFTDSISPILAYNFPRVCLRCRECISVYSSSRTLSPIIFPADVRYYFYPLRLWYFGLYRIILCDYKDFIYWNHHGKDKGSLQGSHFIWFVILFLID